MTKSEMLSLIVGFAIGWGGAFLVVMANDLRELNTSTVTYR